MSLLINNEHASDWKNTDAYLCDMVKKEKQQHGGIEAKKHEIMELLTANCVR